MKSAELEVAEKLVQAYIEGNQEAYNKQAQRVIVNNIFPVNVL